MRNFRSDQRGIVAAVVVGTTLLLVTLMAWVVTMYPAAMIWDTLAPMMPANTHGTMTLLNNVAGWTLIIEVVGILAWIGVHAYIKETVDVQA